MPIMVIIIHKTCLCDPYLDLTIRNNNLMFLWVIYKGLLTLCNKRACGELSVGMMVICSAGGGLVALNKAVYALRISHFTFSSRSKSKKKK